MKIYDGIEIKYCEIVNFLEAKPINEIKAKIRLINKNNVEIILGAHVIATIKINFVNNSIK